jgi:hypothetical protein
MPRGGSRMPDGSLRAQLAGGQPGIPDGLVERVVAGHEAGVVGGQQVRLACQQRADLGQCACRRLTKAVLGQRALTAKASLGSGADCQMTLLRAAVIRPCAIIASRLRL